MRRWRKTVLGAVVVLALVGAGSGASAQTFQKGRIVWTVTAADDGGSAYAVKGGIGNQYRAL